MTNYGPRQKGKQSPLDVLALAQQVADAVNGPASPPSRTPQIGDKTVLDARGYKRPAQTFRDYHVGREPRNKGEKYPPNPPTVTELMAMLNACPDTEFGWRIYAAIVIAWQAGLRAFEMLALIADDLDRASGSIQVRHGKGDKQAMIKMAAWAWDLLDPWLEIRTTLPNPRGPVICVIDGPTAGRSWSYADSNKILKKVAIAAGVTKRMSWHQLRHAFAAWSFVDGVDVRTIQLQLRHSNIGITDVYLQGLGVSKSQEAVYTAPVPSIPATALLALTTAKKRAGTG